MGSARARSLGIGYVDSRLPMNAIAKRIVTSAAISESVRVAMSCRCVVDRIVALANLRD